ncbi:hyccin-like isoform X2 [Tubulanus polymorphus]|uniref:hyccin-like isoform X2 n=1 Tax=Tubulanus polymorphus TaxID=672921 RepID=UPI003DA6015E
MGSPDARIKEWLAEYKGLSEAEGHTYANTVRHNEDLRQSLYSLFQHDYRHEVLDPVCHQLFEFYRSPEPELRQFTLEYIPALVYSYLLAVSRNNKKNYAGVEALLLGIYNLEIVNSDGSQKIYSFTIPSLSKASVYHEPYSLSALSLSESVLSRHDQNQQRIFSYGPFPQVERINSQNRLTVISFLLNCYNNNIATLSEDSHQTLCKACLNIAHTGFENLGTQDVNGPSGARLRKGVSFQEDLRITVGTDLLLEMLAGLYFVMFNTHPRLAIQAVNAIHERASYELAADVLLVTNAIRNSLKHHPTEGEDMQSDPMGISVSLTPSSSSTGFNKAAITNASFRAKKLPDDIPVPSDEEDTNPISSNIVPPNIMSDDNENEPKKNESEKSKGPPKISLKSVLKKTDKLKKKDSDNKGKGHVSLNTSVNGDNSQDSENNKRVSVTVLQGQTRSSIVDSVELKTYVRNTDSQSSSRMTDDHVVNAELTLQDPDENSKHTQSTHIRDHRNSFTRPNSSSINTEV